MVSRWILTGAGTELTADIEDLVVNFIKTNWAETNPGVNAIKFGDDWWDDYGDFQIHANENVKIMRRMAVGAAFAEYDAVVDLHIFARRLSEMQTDPQLGNMEREIQRIIHLYYNQVSSSLSSAAPGILFIRVNDIRQIPEPTNVSTVWHSVVSTTVKYAMARIES